MISCKLYDAAGHDRTFDEPASLPDLDSHQILWLKAVAPSKAEIGKLRDLLKLDPDSVAELSRSDRRLTLSNYEDYFHLDVLAIPDHPAKDADRLEPPKIVRLDVIAGENWLLTVTPEKVDFLDDFTEQYRGETTIGGLSSPAFAAAVLDWHLSEYLDALEAVEEFVDRLDVRLLRGDIPDESLVDEVQAGRRCIAVLRRGLAPQRVVFYGMSRPDFARAEKASHYFDALERRFDRVVDAVEHGRALVQGTFDLFEARVGSTTNILIRRLTFLSVMLAVIGSVAGIFGMNFETPYTKAGVIGFWLVIGALIGFALAATLIGRWRKWI
jgi:Mg2+ and Co2+ transporter CorA